MSKNYLHSIVTIVVCFIFAFHSQLSHAQKVGEIGLTIETDIEIYNSKGDQWTEDLRESLLLGLHITNAFHSLEGVKVVSSDLNEKEGMFGVIVNISHLPENSYYTLNSTIVIKYLLDWEDSEDPNKQVWVHQETVQFVVDNPRDFIDTLASYFNETRIKPIVNIFDKKTEDTR